MFEANYVMCKFHGLFSVCQNNLINQITLFCDFHRKILVNLHISISISFN